MPDSEVNLSVFRSRLLSFSADEVWSVLKHFKSPLDWNPGVVKVDMTGEATAPGCIRELHIHDGKLFKERLLKIDHQERSISYEMLECPMPVWNYTAQNSVIPVTASNQSVVIWQSNFSCRKINKEKMEFYFGISAYEEGLIGIELLLKSKKKEVNR